MPYGTVLSLLTVLHLTSSFARADLCVRWSDPIQAGLLDIKFLSEASGITVSKQFPNRLYHHNDSGGGPFFYLTTLSGSDTQKIEVSDMKAEDIEDMSLGPCDGDSCLFLGDTGDNTRSRANLELWLIRESETFSSSVRGWKHLKLHYPDGPHDAEALAVHPHTGDVYILTKEFDLQKFKASPSKLFRLQANKINQAQDADDIILEDVYDFDLPFLTSTFDFFGQIVTGMDISPDGSKLLVLTYQNVLEIRFELLKNNISTHAWQLGQDYQVIESPIMKAQHEAISYSPDGKSFYFDNEFNIDLDDTEAPLYRVECLDTRNQN